MKRTTPLYSLNSASQPFDRDTENPSESQLPPQQSQQAVQQQIINTKKEKLIRNISGINKSRKYTDAKQLYNLNSIKRANINRDNVLPYSISHPCGISNLEFQQNINQFDEEGRQENDNLSLVIQGRKLSIHEDLNDPSCRICFQKDSKLISPCRCKGSLMFVHEDCLIQWLQSSNRKKCELCQTPFYIYKGMSSFQEFLKNVKSHFSQDKSRLIRLSIYFVYLWLLKNRLFNLIRVYYNMVKQMKALWMLKALYNLFIIMLVFQLATDEYGRIKKIVQFLKNASVKIRVRGIKNEQELRDISN